LKKIHKYKIWLELLKDLCVTIIVRDNYHRGIADSPLTLTLLQDLQWVLIIQFFRWQLYNPLFLSKSRKRGLQYQADIQWYSAILKVLCFISLETLSLQFLATLCPWYSVNCFFILTHEHGKLNRIKWDYLNASSWINTFGWPTKSSHSFLLAILEINCAYLQVLTRVGWVLEIEPTPFWVSSWV